MQTLLLHADADNKMSGLTRIYVMESNFVLSGVRRAHPRLDAIEGRRVVESPRDERGVRRWHGVRAKAHGNIASAVRLAGDDPFPEGHLRTCESSVQGVHEGGIGERLDGTQRRAGNELTVGQILSEALAGGQTNNVVGTLRALGPWNGKIKMVTGAPRNGLVVVVGEREFAREAERRKTIGDDELELIGVSRAALVVGNHRRGEAAGIEPGDGKIRLAGQTVHRHRTANTVGGAPEMDVAAIKSAGTEGEKEGISTAHFEEIFGGGELGPVDDVTHGTVAEGKMPVHEARAFFGQGEERGTADTPAGERLAEVGNLLHAGRKNGDGVVGKGFSGLAVGAARVLETPPRGSTCATLAWRRQGPINAQR